MASVAVDHSGIRHAEPRISENILVMENKTATSINASESNLQPSPEEHIPAEESLSQGKITGTEALDKGYLKYGYVLLAICVLIIVGGAKSELLVAMRYLIAVTVTMRQRSYAHFVILNRRSNKFAQIVVYAWEDTIVQFASYLMMTHLKSSIIAMGVVFAATSGKGAFPIISSINAPIGGSKNFFHCDKCGCCYSVLLKSSHPCVERAMHQDCPVCFEYLFDSRNDVIAMPCGHTIHKTCLVEMQEHYKYACPICSKSVCDMSKVWEKFDLEIAATPMPTYYENKMSYHLKCVLQYACLALEVCRIVNETFDYRPQTKNIPIVHVPVDTDEDLGLSPSGLGKMMIFMPLNLCGEGLEKFLFSYSKRLSTTCLSSGNKHFVVYSI
ncbi:E3 ubiquitin-protein ligase RZFP34 [Sesamum angolense]|uniref:E3 ubiquitin-protein ligase RZFP34 n=1 Tax=Sesamum angolense TaxID=2727404 RepID=A0AAE1W8U5_9LAMI|nr:E3 ubiquitin-protein ligase RZFP34 [Sesamum angolense]